MNWSRNLFLWLVVNESLDLKRKNNEINLFSTIHVLKDKKRLTFVNSCVPFFPLSVALMKSVSIKVSVSDTKLKIIWMTSLCAKGLCVTASQRWCKLVDIFLKYFFWHRKGILSYDPNILQSILWYVDENWKPNAKPYKMRKPKWTGSLKNCTFGTKTKKPI